MGEAIVDEKIKVSSNDQTSGYLSTKLVEGVAIDLSGAFCYLTLKTQKPLDSRFPKELKTLGAHLRKKRLAPSKPQKEEAGTF